MTSSCCPAFVRYIETQFPKLVDKISYTPFADGDHREIYQGDAPGCKIVFIGPLHGEKAEI